MLKRGEAGPGATNPLRRRCTTVATFLVPVNLGELKELDTKQATSVLDSVYISFLFISPTIRTLALVSGSTSHIRDITRRKFCSTRTYIQSVGIQRDFGVKKNCPGPLVRLDQGPWRRTRRAVAPNVTGQLVAR